MVFEHEYKKGRGSELDHLRGRPFVAIDPGKTGAAIFYGSPISRPLHVLSFDGLENAALGCVDGASVFMPSVAVIEDQFVISSNPRSSVKLARRAGILIGAMASVSPIEVVYVPPATWQYAVLDLPKHAKSKDRKEAALAYADGYFQADMRYTMLNKEERKGVADALGIARWWQGE